MTLLKESLLSPLYIFRILFLALILSHTFIGHTDIVINEIMTSTDQKDEFGTPLEWIELYNSGNQAENLLGYTLTDDPLAPGKWMFGVVELPAKGYFRVWATGYDLLDYGNYHTNFRLDRDGEMLALFSPDSVELDVINYPAQRKDVSFGRKPDGSEEWRFFSEPTPNKANNTLGIIGFAEAPDFSITGGIFTQPVSLELNTQDPDADIRYTLDGSEPIQSSNLYKSPLSITQTTLVRSRVFHEDYLPSPIATHSYIFREKMTLPILSLVAEPDDLYSRSSGIYQNPNNSGRTWERPVSVEFFTMDGERKFQEDSGIRIHGGASRTRSPKKSFRLYFRSEYGAKRLEYPLFPNAGVDKINQIVIRGGFNDTWGYDNASQRYTAIYVSDQVVRDLHLDMKQPASDGIFVELYVNGENWGIYNPSERIEEDFLEQHSGIEGWTVVADGSDVKDGDPNLWNEFTQWILRTNFSTSAGLEEFDQKIDRESFTTFVMLNVWVQNYDWPHHNWLCARENADDGKWKFFSWDVEYSFGSGSRGYSVDVDVYDRALGDSIIGPIFSKLVKNPDYQAYYWQRVNHYLDTVLNEEHVLARLNARLDEIKDSIPWESEKWGERKGSDPKRTPEDWEAAAQMARDFITARTPIFLQHTINTVGPKPVAVSNWQLY